MKRYFPILIAFVLTLSACSNQARIDGQFADRTSTPVYLEIVTPGRMAVVDSTTTNKKGEFRFRINIKDGDPTIFNVRTGDEFIPTIVAPGERISLSSMGRLAENYQISGSTESESMQSVYTLLTVGAANLADLSKQYMESADDQARKDITTQYLKRYYEIKREHIGFVVRNASSLAGLYALYQRLPGDEVLFNGESDIVYYRMVADSMSNTYPSSKYLAALNRDIATFDKTMQLGSELAEKLANPTGFPPIKLPNLYGEKVALEEVVAENRATLVYFWRADLQNAASLNADLKTIYEEYHQQGFEVYQISLDTSKPNWVAAVQGQKLPWISLCDFQGAGCPAYTAYNVTSLPSTFLIDENGDLVGKDLFGDALISKLDQLLQ